MLAHKVEGVGGAPSVVLAPLGRGQGFFGRRMGEVTTAGPNARLISCSVKSTGWILGLLPYAQGRRS